MVSIIRILKVLVKEIFWCYPLHSCSKGKGTSRHWPDPRQTQWRTTGSPACYPRSLSPCAHVVPPSSPPGSLTRESLLMLTNNLLFYWNEMVFLLVFVSIITTLPHIVLEILRKYSSAYLNCKIWCNNYIFEMFKYCFTVFFTFY